MAKCSCRNAATAPQLKLKVYVPVSQRHVLQEFMLHLWPREETKNSISLTDKDKWINVERLRWSRLFEVPMAKSMPDNFPPFTLTIMRTLCALTASDPDQEKLCQSLDALFNAFWVGKQPTHQPEVMQQVLKQVLGEDEAVKGMSPVRHRFMKILLLNYPCTAIEMAKNEGKTLLLQNTDKAYDDGAFGLPWFICTNSEGKTEGFWGVDHLGQVTNFLGLEMPKIGGWKAML